MLQTQSKIQLSNKIINLKQYDLVFTTSWECVFGVCGHLYEMIDYYYVCKQSGINCAILLTDTTTKEVFTQSLDKYNFTHQERNDILNHTYECPQPKILMTNNLCIVDGSWRWNGCTVYANNLYLLRCSEPDFKPLENTRKSINHIHLLQDFKLYPERFEDMDIKVIDYTKKILWSKYKQPTIKPTSTALLYLTTACRQLPLTEVQQVMARYPHDNYLIVTNDVVQYKSLECNTVRVESAPVTNLFDRFSTYIYTSIPDQKDCSPRFVVECAAFDRQVIYDIDYQCQGLERRKEDIAQGINNLLLTTQDGFIEYVRQTS